MPAPVDTARAAAMAGGAVLDARKGDVGGVRVKGAQTDVVSETDIEAGVAIVRSIVEAHPNARFVVEEEEVYDLADVARGELDDSEVWVVDPLDGTTSFVHGYPFYSVSVALVRDGVPSAGAIYYPFAAEMFSAVSGEGAHLGGARLSCTSVDRLEDALLVTGFPYDRGALFDRQHAVLGRLMRLPIHGVRRDGSAALDCTHVAAGRADGFWEFGLQPWDTAAGVVICTEAGARVTGVEGEPWTVSSTGIVAANPALHGALLEAIGDVGTS